MKKFAITILAFALPACLAAQTHMSSLINEYAGKQGITTFSISGTQLKKLADNDNSSINKITELKIVVAENTVQILSEVQRELADTKLMISEIGSELSGLENCGQHEISMKIKEQRIKLMEKEAFLADKISELELRKKESEKNFSDLKRETGAFLAEDGYELISTFSNNETIGETYFKQMKNGNSEYLSTITESGFLKVVISIIGDIELKDVPKISSMISIAN